ncbi:3-oxoadipate enol-lactonase [Roseibium litorale]|uniref:3-oxoadipate enol-lactonase n=1 Tax=Roseibium litorale TaxID=2803841 RepID=A0ABR9CPT4_9HYPH|nr:3-oxoadipate enol-lactonase [Roseibium litorale]MBD8892773.1 3-oxoadipate enol-lactonase [Roseibium litorale]
MHMIEANGVTLHTADTGETGLPVIVFANSLGTDFRSWDRVAERLAGRFRMIRYDKRGHGLSSAPDAPYKMADHVNDLAALLDQLNTGPAIVVGLSVGGQIAQGLAISRPDLVRALVLCDTAAKIGTAEMWQTRMNTIETGGIAALAEPILERWFSAEFRSSRPAELAGWRAMLTRTPVQGYLGTCAAIRDTDFTEETAKLTLPVLALCGTEDGATPPELVEATAKLIKGARYVPIQGAGHLPCIEAPDALVQALTDFLKENALV